MSNIKTFQIGKLLVKVYAEGIATKNQETGEIRRYPFPWRKPAAPADAAYDEPRYDEPSYDEPPYDEEDYPEDSEYAEPEYADDGDYHEDDDDYEAQSSLLDAPWLMWAALVLLPPLGIWLLWRSKRFNITWNSVISALSAIWFLIVLIWLFSGMNRNNEDINLPSLETPPPTLEPSESPTPSPTPDPTAIPDLTPTPTPEPTPQPGGDQQMGQTGTNQETQPTASAEPTWVWSKEGGTWYHADSTCGGMKDATRVTLAVAQNRKQTACPTCMPAVEVTKPTATPIPEGYYFSRPDGTWYHTDPNCQGMTSAQVISQADAIARNQTACPICIGSVYMTDGGTWYHSISNCQNMTGAYLSTIEKAIDAGKTACPQCMNGTATGNTGTTITGNNTGSSDIFYYNPNGGTYYHKTENCSGMKNAVKGTAAAAENNGKKPCPTCLGGTSANASFYATTNGTYYHTKSDCSGMRNATRITEATAISRGKTACPECAGGVATGGTRVEVNTGNADNRNDTTVTQTTTKFYSTIDGKYFHVKDDCSGMKNATEVDAREVEKRNQEPCPRCIGTSGTYFSTETGNYYHSKADCSGMKNADIVTLAMINARKQNPCPDCIGGGVTGKTYYWATANGAYYHSKSNCSGMNGATKVTEDEAEDRDQLPCPTCVGSVWGTEDGKFYHKDKRCSGMKDAGHLTIQAAEKSGKTACPECILSVTPTPKPTATPKPGEDDNDSSLYYYATEDGSYYHRESDCTGMKGAKKVSENTAVARGQKPCPECIGSVWATEGGDHYHARKDCSGMRGASLVTVDTAELRGQSPCPECLSDGDHDAPQDGSTTGGSVVTDTDNTYVYCTLEGKYYHSEQHCQGMRNAGSVSLTWALERNYQRCTKCDAPIVR